jgi:predicted nuclease with RNAse H fold
MSTDVYVGIDVACAKKKRLPICFVAIEGGRLRPLVVPVDCARKFPRGKGNVEVRESDPFAADAVALRQAIQETAEILGWRITRIAIDAPAVPPQAGMRACERKLSELGLSVFTTDSIGAWDVILETCRAHLKRGGALARLPYANKIWMLYGFRIFAELARLSGSPELIEVYPHSIMQALIPGDVKHKTITQGFRAQLEAIAEVAGWEAEDLDIALRQAVPEVAHDRLDAFASSWVASLTADYAGQSICRTFYGSNEDPLDRICNAN